MIRYIILFYSIRIKDKITKFFLAIHNCIS